MKPAEKNIDSFNADVSSNTGYLYTTNNRISSVFSNARISEAVAATVDMRGKRVLDVGCGDGTYTQEFLKLDPAFVLGLDPAENAIASARTRFAKADRLSFEVGNIYDMEFAEKFDVAVIRGVLHHVYDPKRAIAQACKVAHEIVVVEPNGYNPVLKMIEQLSSYHREHEERSYAPSSLRKWFRDNGAEIVSGGYVGLVPFFCPNWMAKVLKALEPSIESIPLVREIGCGQYVVKVKAK